MTRCIKSIIIIHDIEQIVTIFIMSKLFQAFIYRLNQAKPNPVLCLITALKQKTLPYPYSSFHLEYDS